MQNADLKYRYDEVYAIGPEKFFTGNSFNESKTIMAIMESWEGKRVLEIGCGQGNLAAMIAFAGADHVDAIDYSLEAIAKAGSRVNLPNVTFKCMSYEDHVAGSYDAVVMQGVLEHLDNPFDALTEIMDKHVAADGLLITSSPSFVNPRGYVWMTLQLLFDVPMSLTDQHFICPFHMKEYADDNGLKIDMMFTDHDWASGEKMIKDFEKRLPNALRDANLPVENVDRLLKWLKKVSDYQKYQRLFDDSFTGATAVYKLW